MSTRKNKKEQIFEPTEIVGVETKTGMIIRVVKKHFFDDGKPFWDLEIFSKWEQGSVVYIDCNTKKEALYLYRNLKSLIP